MHYIDILRAVINKFFPDEVLGKVTVRMDDNGGVWIPERKGSFLTGRTRKLTDAELDSCLAKESNKKH